MGSITYYPISYTGTSPIQTEPFIAGAGDTTFTPTLFILNTTCLVFVNGAYQSWGWSIVAGSIVFAVGLVAGSEVLIIN